MVEMNMDDALMMMDICDRIAGQNSGPINFDFFGKEEEIANISKRLYDCFDNGLMILGISDGDRARLKSFVHRLDVPLENKKQVFSELFDSNGDAFIPNYMLRGGKNDE